MLIAITDLDAYRATRTSWHALAERVLAPARHAHTGRIGLRPAPGGITTGPFGDDRSLSLDAGSIIATAAGTTVSEPITTLGAAAALAEVDLAHPIDVFTPTTPADPDRELALDGDALTALADWFAFAEGLLEHWSADRAAETPSAIQLWPEHFDLALDLGAEGHRANYGASPGDAGHERPYLYVGPWNPDGDPFWNAGTYARLGYDALTTAEDPRAAALAFFRAGHAVAARAESPPTNS